MTRTDPSLHLDKTAIRALIPHAGAMCLLDAVQAWDAGRIECLAYSHRAADNPLRRAGALPVQAGIEYAAQAMALHGALTGAPGAAPRRGYLAALHDVRWHAGYLDEDSAPLRVCAQKQAAGGAGASYRFAVSAGARALITGTAVIAFDTGGTDAGPV